MKREEIDTNVLLTHVAKHEESKHSINTTHYGIYFITLHELLQTKLSN